MTNREQYEISIHGYEHEGSYHYDIIFYCYATSTVVFRERVSGRNRPESGIKLSTALRAYLGGVEWLKVLASRE
jgi:hypothetical protein